MRYIDIHAHLDDTAYDTDRADVLRVLKEHEIGVITIGTTLQSSQQASELARANTHVFACIGVHPDDGAGEIFIEKEYEAILHPRVVGVGECGLDYFRANKADVYPQQKALFEAQIQFAISHNLPLMLHVRPRRGTCDAYHDALDILESYAREFPTLRGNSHFFAGDVAVASRLFAIGFTISFTGVITFAREYDEVIQYAPLECIHAETDAPYVAPVPYRKERNNPLYISEIVRRLAEIKGIQPEKLEDILLNNAARLFNLGL